MKTLALLVSACCVLLPTSAWSLDLGDPAPALEVTEWIKGEKTDLAAGKDKHVYVVEFWATWCPPCRESIPHLSSLQQRYKDKGLIVVGLSSEGPEEVKPFVARMGENMNYTVGIDKDNKTAQAYMLPFGVRGIPHAFVVDKTGKLAWHGHPGGSLEWAVKQALAGKLDLETSKAMIQTEKLIPEYFKLAMEGEDSKRATILGGRIVADAATNPDLLSEFALTILFEKDLAIRDKRLALKAAKSAFDTSSGKELMPVVAYARALFENGQSTEAVTQQKQALKLCRTQDQIALIEKDLKEFEAKAR